MKVKLWVIVSILLSVLDFGCSDSDVFIPCQSRSLESDFEIGFSGKEIRSFRLSPFEKNKVIIEFTLPKIKMIEYDLITKDTQSIDDNLRKISLLRNLYFQNLQDSIIWIGGGKFLLKYDIRTKQVSKTSINSVSKILRYKSSTYFFASKDLFLKEDGSDKIMKVQNLSDSIKLNGVYIYDNIRWQMMKNLYSYRYRIPEINKYNPTYYYDNNIRWISRPGQLFIVDTEINKKYNIVNDKYISLIYDDCYIYLLYKDKLHVQLKSEFINSCSEFDESKYLLELSKFNKFMDSTAIRQDRNEMSVLNKYREIKDRYKRSTHPEILEQLKNLDLNAFQSVFYETNAAYQNCYTNEELPLTHRVSCFMQLMLSEVRKFNYEKALAYEKESISLFKAKDLKGVGYFQSDMDSIRNYIVFRDSLNNINTSLDTLEYLQSKALYKICKTRFYSTESGINDYGLMEKRLLKFIKNYPNSEYRDNAEFWLINNRYLGNLEVDLQQIKDYELFRMKFPDSDILSEVDFRILSILIYSDEVSTAEFINMAEAFLKKYPDSKRIEAVKQYMRNFKY